MIFDLFDDMDDIVTKYMFVICDFICVWLDWILVRRQYFGGRGCSDYRWKSFFVLFCFVLFCFVLFFQFIQDRLIINKRPKADVTVIHISKTSLELSYTFIVRWWCYCNILFRFRIKKENKSVIVAGHITKITSVSDLLFQFNIL